MIPNVTILYAYVQSMHSRNVPKLVRYGCNHTVVQIKYAYKLSESVNTIVGSYPNSERFAHGNTDSELTRKSLVNVHVTCVICTRTLCYILSRVFEYAMDNNAEVVQLHAYTTYLSQYQSTTQ